MNVIFFCYTIHTLTLHVAADVGSAELCAINARFEGVARQHRLNKRHLSVRSDKQHYREKQHVSKQVSLLM